VTSLALLITQLLAILAAARLAGRAARAIGQPRVVGEMLAGIALGPSILGAVAPRSFRALFPAGGMAPLETLSQVGIILFMFVVGLSLDHTLLRGRVRAAVVISHASIVIPFALGAVVALWLYPGLAGPEVARLPFVLFLGAAMSVTAFPVLARILAERKLAGTPLGSIATACAAVDDVTAWCLLAAVVAVARSREAVLPVTVVILGAAVYTALAATVGRRLLEWWFIRHSKDAVAEGSSTSSRQGPSVQSGRSGGGMSVAVLLALGSALITEVIGVHALFGAFIAGTIMPRTHGFAAAIAESLDDAVTTVFVPVFFAFTGLRTEVGLITQANLWGVFAIILLAALAGKLGGSAGAARITGLGWREAIAIGVLMNTRGLMELVILNVGLEIGVIAESLFAIMVLMAIATTVMTSPLLDLILGQTPAAARAPARTSARP
jgi:K+:H+ antiporter